MNLWFWGGGVQFDLSDAGYMALNLARSSVCSLRALLLANLFGTEPVSRLTFLLLYWCALYNCFSSKMASG